VKPQKIGKYKKIPTKKQKQNKNNKQTKLKQHGVIP
jgi:hypothetical protein